MATLVRKRDASPTELVRMSRQILEASPVEVP
jgi:hypothetical protein